ncbi:LXG domain-containing protein [Enterococcus faecalis]|uniref:LXG domain-containing protein n=1 Tax=Enterococcus faecalis TaxID=1351 RepID=UPI0021C5B27C|nr:LXG domain-containing protein [Enterococcus faecalis]
MVRYVRADSQALVSSMKTTIQQAHELTSKLNQGSQQLVQSVDGKQLSGAAFTAGKGLFEQVIIPTIKRADQAIQSLEQDLARYRHAEMAMERWSLIDSELQQELIRSLQRQLRTIDYQIDMARQLESSLIGELAKPILHAIHMDTQRLHNAKVALLDKLREAEQKLNGLKQFDHQTALLFENSLQQLKIVTQSIQVLNGTKVDSATGKYTLPIGFDNSWFTSVKKRGVTDEKKQIEMEQKKIDADIIAKSRISWIDTTKEILSEFINDVEKFFPHLIEVLQRVKDLEDDMIDKDMQIEINKLFDQVSQQLDIIHKNSMLIKLNFSDSEEHAPIIDVIDRIVYEINFSSNYRDENRSEITERELNFALDKKSEVFNETKRLVQLLRVYYKMSGKK